MDYKYIEQLLSRYFEGDTTLKEEQILKAFFAQDDEDVPLSLRRCKSLFEAMEQGDDVLGDDFDDRILSLVGNASERYDLEVGNASEPCNTEESPAIPQKARVISLHERFRPLLRAAAIVAVILTLSTAVNQSFRDDNVWTDEDQIARYQDEMRKAALAAATADSVLLYSEGFGIKADSISSDTIRLAPTGYLE